MKEMSEADFMRLKADLQHRSRFRAYHAVMRDRGVRDAELRFPFLDWGEAELLVQRLAVLHRSHPNVVYADRPSALGRVSKWLESHSGTVHCYIPNIGALAADATLFLREFAFFSELIADNLLFATPTLDSSVRAQMFEGDYYCSGW